MFEKKQYFCNANKSFTCPTFDGEEELILGCCVGGLHGSPSYDIYEMTDSGLVEKEVEGESWLGLNADIKFVLENRMITNTLAEGAYAWGKHHIFR